MMGVGEDGVRVPAQSTRARAFTGASILLHETPCGLAKIGDGYEAVCGWVLKRIERVK